MTQMLKPSPSVIVEEERRKNKSRGKKQRRGDEDRLKI